MSQNKVKSQAKKVLDPNSYLDDDYKYGFSNPEEYKFKSRKGLDESIVAMISDMKNEPLWMKEFRLLSYKQFLSQNIPSWAPKEVHEVDFDDIFYFIRAMDDQGKTWEDVPDEIKSTFDKLGIPEAERKFLAGVSAQYESEVVYHSLISELTNQGVIFTDMDTGLREHPEIVKKYFGKLIPPVDNKFAALNSAVWSGGSFVYIPEGVKVKIPLQAYFRINAKNAGQFERTLIIAEKGSSIHYIEGCTAPIYSTNSLHSAVVEIFVHEDAKVQYTTVQNWSKNVFNLVTKRAIAYKNAQMTWIDGNLGSKLTMKYPSVYLAGEGAKGTTVSIAMSGKDQVQDAGSRMIHLASNTSSEIISKSISKSGGKTIYRGKIDVRPGLKNIKSSVKCDALILDEISSSDTIPVSDIQNTDIEFTHEASVSRISDEQMTFLRSRGINAEKAASMIVNGFIEPFTSALPVEYSVELYRLVNLEMEGSVG
ncbi:MAG: Fe-S cluster assembly protein SufB [bacterium]